MINCILLGSIHLARNYQVNACTQIDQMHRIVASDSAVSRPFDCPRLHRAQSYCRHACLDIQSHQNLRSLYRFAGLPGIVAFDLDCFLNMAQRSRKWQDPHTLRNMTVKQLQLDSWMQPIIDRVKVLKAPVHPACRFCKLCNSYVLQLDNQLVICTACYWSVVDGIKLVLYMSCSLLCLRWAQC